MPSRLAEVVLPLDEGPEISTTRAAQQVGLENGVGHLGELAFVERLGEFYHASGVAREDLGIDVAHGGDPPMMRTHDWYSRKMPNILS